MKSKNKTEKDNMSGSFIPTIFSKLVFDFFQNWLRDFHQGKNIKKNDVIEEKLITVENLQLKLEKKVKENKANIISIKNLLVTSMFINIIMFIIIIVFLIMIY